MYETNFAAGKRRSEVLPCCLTSPFTRVVTSTFDGSKSVAIMGPKWLKCVERLADHYGAHLHLGKLNNAFR